MSIRTSGHSLDMSRYADTPCDSLVAILTCRFLLALQSANQEALGQRSIDTLGGNDANGGTLRFASRVIGSVGASIMDGSRPDDLGGRDDEEERETGLGAECTGDRDQADPLEATPAREEEEHNEVVVVTGP